MNNTWHLVCFEKEGDGVPGKIIKLPAIDVDEVRKLFDRPLEEKMDNYFYDLKSEEQFKYFENILKSTLNRNFRYAFENDRLLVTGTTL